MSGFTNFVSPSHVSGKAWNTTPYLDFRVVSEKKKQKKNISTTSVIKQLPKGLQILVMHMCKVGQRPCWL